MRRGCWCGSMCGGGIQAGRPCWVVHCQPDFSKVRWWWPQISAALSIVVGPPSAQGSDVVDLGPGCGAVAGGEGAAAVSGQDREALVLAEQAPGVAVPGDCAGVRAVCGGGADGEDALVGAAPAQRVTGRDERAVAGLGQPGAGRGRTGRTSSRSAWWRSHPRGQRPGHAQPGQCVQQRVVAPLPGRAAVFDPVGFRGAGPAPGRRTRRGGVQAHSAVSSARTPRLSGNDRADASAINPCPTAANRREQPLHLPQRIQQRRVGSPVKSTASSASTAAWASANPSRGPAHLDSASLIRSILEGRNRRIRGYPQPEKPTKIKPIARRPDSAAQDPSPTPRRCAFRLSKQNLTQPW